MHNTEELLKNNVSFQNDTWSSISKEIPISQVLREIKEGTYKILIERLRTYISENNIEAYKAEKLKLPAVTFCATFNSIRKKDSIKAYSALIVLDIDKLSNEELERVKQVLSNCEYVFSYWTSPSNNGIKGLVSIEYDFNFLHNIDNSHKSAFYKLKKYFSENHSIILDGSGNDTTRLCFLSYDSDLVVKEHSAGFNVSEADLNTVYVTDEIEKEKKISKVKNLNKKDALYNPKGKNKNFNRKEIKQFINFLTNKKISIADQYDTRYKIAYAISNTFTYDIGIKYFLAICNLDKNYNELKATKLLEYCYENNTGWTKFKFIEDQLKENGYLKKMEKAVSQ